MSTLIATRTRIVPLSLLVLSGAAITADYSYGAVRKPLIEEVTSIY